MKHVVLAVLLVLLVGCGGDPQPRFSSAPPAPATSSAAPAVETPQAFLRRWYRVSDQMELTGKTRGFDSMHLKSCKGCDVYSASVRAIYQAGRKIRGTKTDVLRLRRLGPARWAIEVRNAATKVIDAAGRTVGSYPGGRTSLRIVLAHCGAALCVRSEVRIG